MGVVIVFTVYNDTYNYNYCYFVDIIIIIATETMLLPMLLLYR